MGAGPPTVTGKVLRVLAAFTSERPELSLTEIVDRAGLAMTTGHRLVGELTAAGLLERGEDRRYRIGLRLWEIAALAPRGPGLRERALPYMEDLYEVTRENVQLAVREGAQVVFVERIAGRHAVGVRTRVGGRFSMPATGVGLVLLAHAPIEVQEQVLAQPLPRFTARTTTDPVRLRSQLAEIRRTGYAISEGQITTDAVSVAAPVFGEDQQVAAALSVVVRAGDTRPSSLVPAVRAAARAISRAVSGPRTS